MRETALRRRVYGLMERAQDIDAGTGEVILNHSITAPDCVLFWSYTLTGEQARIARTWPPLKEAIAAKRAAWKTVSPEQRRALGRYARRLVKGSRDERRNHRERN